MYMFKCIIEFYLFALAVSAPGFDDEGQPWFAPIRKTYDMTNGPKDQDEADPEEVPLQNSVAPPPWASPEPSPTSPSIANSLSNSDGLYEQPNSTSLDGNSSSPDFDLSSDIFNGTLSRNTSDTINASYTIDISSLMNDSSLPRLSNGGRTVLDTWLSTDGMTSGNYLIINCDARGGPNSRASQLQDILPTIHRNLIRVMSEVEQAGTASTYGFSALFKTFKNTKSVTKVYTKIAKGVSVRFKASRNGARKPPEPPQIYCMRPDDDPDNAAGYQHCLSRPRMPAFWESGTAAIALCPAFWTLPRDPGMQLCPAMKNGVVPTNFVQLQFNQQATVIHEMAHMYLGERSAVEQISLKDAVDLSWRRVLLNPSNYAYFFASVVAKCRGWPQSGTGVGGVDGGL